jgi:pimeloyl-ACP methyl ester carboxylesterase
MQRATVKLGRLVCERVSIPPRREGAPVLRAILLHGLLGSRRSFDRCLRELARLPDRDLGFEVLAPDLRNHGASFADADHSYLALLSDLEAVLELPPRLGAEDGDEAAAAQREPALLVGHSMGGKLGMLASLVRPELVAGLLVVDAAPHAYSHSHAHMLHAMRDAPLHHMSTRMAVLSHLRACGLHQDEVSFAVSCLVEEPGKPLRWNAHLGHLIAQEPHVHGWPLDQVLSARGSSKLVPFTGPAIFFGGDRGRLGVEAYARSIAPIFPRHQLRVIHAGHFPHYEQPELFARLLAQLAATQVAP